MKFKKLSQYCAWGAMGIIALGTLFVTALAVRVTVGGVALDFTPSGPLAPEALLVQSGDQGNGSAMITGGLYVGTAGTKFSQIKFGSGTVKNGATTGTAAISGIDSTWNVTTEITKTYSGSVYKKASVAETGAVDLIMSGDPGTTITFSSIAWK